MPLDYVVVAVAAIGAAMTAAPTVFGTWHRPALRRGAVAVALALVAIGALAVARWLGPGLSTTLAWVMIVASVVLAGVGISLLVLDERTPSDAGGPPGPSDAEAPAPAGMSLVGMDDLDLFRDDAETTPVPARADLTEAAQLFSTTRHGWSADLADLLADDDAPPSRPRRGA